MAEEKPDCMELLQDADVTSMDVSAGQTALLGSPDAFAIASMGRLLGERIHAEVQEYTAVLGRLVLDMQRSSISGAEDAARAAAAGAEEAAAGPAGLQERCCAAKLLRMHALMAAIGRALDGADQ